MNEAFQISWVYVEGDSPNDQFAIEVQGEAGYLQWFGFYSSSGSTSATGVPSTGCVVTSLVARVYTDVHVQQRLYALGLLK